MKKTFFVMASVALLGLGACQNEEQLIGVGEEAAMNFTVALADGASSRTAVEDMGKGTAADRALLQVYEKQADGTYTPYGDQRRVEVSNKTAAFNGVRVVTGRTYKFVFWADKKGASLEEGKYYTTASLENITIKGDYAVNNDERDAFFASEELTVSKSESRTIELKRPFGQLNVLTTDLASLPTKDHPAKVKVTYTQGAGYNGLNALTGEVVGTATTQVVSTTVDAVDAATGYEVMDYLFVPAEQEMLVDFTTDYYDASGNLIVSNDKTANIPMRRNYRTIVSGNMLSNGLDYNVVIKPEFEGVIEVWDGEAQMQPAETTVDVDGKQVAAYAVSSGAELAWVAAKVNSRDPEVAGKSIELTADIDLGGHDWTPVGYTGVAGGHQDEGNLYNKFKLFTGSVIGNGHTIKNAVIDEGAYTARGLFAQVIGTKENPAVIKDVKVENITLKGEGKWAGALVGYVRDVKEISGCSAKNVVVESGNAWFTFACGGLIGFISNTDDITISKCEVDGVEFKGNHLWDNGGFIGKMFAVKNVTIKDCVIKGKMTAGMPLGGKTDANVDIYIGADGFQNTWFIGNITLNSQMNMTVTNVTDNSANFTLTDTFGDQGDITEQLKANCYSWPWLSGAVDGYNNENNLKAARITVDGKQLYPKQ